jgi:hypothetical protein
VSLGSERSSAETMPVVSVQSRPNGLPMANTFCPTLSLAGAERHRRAADPER